MKKCASCNVKPGKDQLSNLLIVPPKLLTMLFGTHAVNVLVCNACKGKIAAGIEIDGLFGLTKLLNDNQ